MADSTGTGGSKRERTMDRILDAAAHLFAEQGAAAVSVRDVAEMAGVSHALVHRYFGNKDDLVLAAFTKSSELVRERVAGAQTASVFVESVFALFLEQPLIPRMMIRNLLEGQRTGEEAPHPDVIPRALELMEADKVAAAQPEDSEMFDAHLIVAAVAAMTLGWTAAEDRLVTRANMGDHDREEVRAELQRLIRRILLMADTSR